MDPNREELPQDAEDPDMMILDALQLLAASQIPKHQIYELNSEPAAIPSTERAEKTQRAPIPTPKESPIVRSSPAKSSPHQRKSSKHIVSHTELISSLEPSPKVQLQKKPSASTKTRNRLPTVVNDVFRALKPNEKVLVEPISSTKASKSPTKKSHAKNTPFKPWATAPAKSGGKDVASVQRKGIFGQGKTSKAFGAAATENLPPDDALSKFKYNPYDILGKKSTEDAPNRRENEESMQIDVSAAESIEEVSTLAPKPKDSVMDVSKMIQEAKVRQEEADEAKLRNRLSEYRNEVRRAVASRWPEMATSKRKDKSDDQDNLEDALSFLERCLNGLSAACCDLETKAKRTMDGTAGGVRQDVEMLVESAYCLLDEFERPGWLLNIPITAYVHEAASIFPAGFYDEATGIFADSPFEQIEEEAPIIHRGLL